MSLSTEIYLASAILPAVFLLWLIYKQDRKEREPVRLLMKLVGGGILAALLAIVLETVFGGVLNQMSFRTEFSMVVANAVMIGLSEEFAKLIFLKWFSWNNPNFNYRFDGIVYAVAVSLGFAAFENVFYVFNYGLQVAVSRALLAVPAHTAFAVYMGTFYGRAKYLDVYGRHKACKINLIAGFLIAAALHAFYDSCAMLGSDTAMIVFAVFVIAMYIIVIRKEKTESKTDHPF